MEFTKKWNGITSSRDEDGKKQRGFPAPTTLEF
jgi:hypothetical protein